MTLQFLSRHRMLAAFLVSTLAMAGCNRSGTLEETADISDTFDDAASSNAARSDSGITVDPLERDRLEQERIAMQNLVVYFDYDRAEIRPEFNSMLAAHGRVLGENPNRQLRLEGHSDERGSREYNIGLGERRAQAVRSVLMLQGASANQLTTVSYGEERPLASGSDEQSWGQNRRVELVYR
jgi:peptidoglycan-associated lipoprotein